MVNMLDKKTVTATVNTEAFNSKILKKNILSKNKK